MLGDKEPPLLASRLQQCLVWMDGCMQWNSEWKSTIFTFTHDKTSERVQLQRNIIYPRQDCSLVPNPSHCSKQSSAEKRSNTPSNRQLRGDQTSQKTSQIHRAILHQLSTPENATSKSESLARMQSICQHITLTRCNNKQESCLITGSRPLLVASRPAW